MTGSPSLSQLLPVLLRREWKAWVAIAAVTLAVELGVFVAARASSLALRESTMAMLAAAAVWIALASPMLAGGAPAGGGAVGGGVCGGYWATVLRAIACADATLLALWAVWAFHVGAGDATLAGDERMTFVDTLQLYLNYLGMAAFGGAVVAIARTPAGRLAAAVAAGVVLMAGLTTPFWAGGLLGLGELETRQSAAALAVYVNPFYSVSSCVEQMQYVLHQETILYGLTQLGDASAPPPCPWYAAGAVYTVAAGVVGAVGLMKRALGR